jgi:hypothetical protein
MHPEDHATRTRLPVVPVGLLAAVAAGLLLGGVVIHYLGLRGANLFYADREGNVWAWYASMLLAVLAVTFWIGTSGVRGAGGRWVPYAALTVVAAAMSVDEAAGLHERLARFAGGVDRPFTWVVPGAVLAVAVGAVLLRLARDIPRDLRRGLVVAGLVFFAGALGVEVFAGRFMEVAADEAAAAQSLPFHVLVVMEEGLETAGTLLALRATSAWLQPRTDERGVRFSPAG